MQRDLLLITEMIDAAILCDTARHQLPDFAQQLRSVAATIDQPSE